MESKTVSLGVCSSVKRSSKTARQPLGVCVCVCVLVCACMKSRNSSCLYTYQACQIGRSTRDKARSHRHTHTHTRTHTHRRTRSVLATDLNTIHGGTGSYSSRTSLPPKTTGLQAMDSRCHFINRAQTRTT